MKQGLTRYFPRLTPDHLVLLLLLVFWGLGIVVVGPHGDFPLNDDWAYARSVYSIVEEGQLTLNNWPAMTLIAQIGIGAIYCSLFDFSFEALRWSTLVNSFLCICFFYFLLRKFVGVPTALFVSLLVFFNPLFFSLSFTFMTEVHFLMALIGSLFFFSKYVESSKYSYLLWGTFFSVIATLIRQPGLLAPLSFGIILFLREKTILRRIAMLLPFLTTFLCLKIYYYWLGTAFPENYKVGGFQDLIYSLLTVEPRDLIGRIVNLFLNPGLFLFPLIIFLLPSMNWKALRSKVPGLCIILFLSIFLAVHLNFFPAGNVFYNLGLGPKLIKGIEWSQNNVYPRLSNDIWKTLDYGSLLGTIGMFLLLIGNTGLEIRPLFRRKNISHKTLIKWSISLFCCFYFLVTILMSSKFDRYALPLIPCIALLILPQKTRFSGRYIVFPILCLIIMALFSMAATHDYLSWNRARKVAFNYLNEAEQIPPTFIDAGFEINGWLQAGPDGFDGTGKSWWFVTEDDYVLAFDKLNGFKKWKAFPFRTLLPIETDSFLLLKKEYIYDFDYDEFPISSDLERRSDNQEKFISTHPNVEFSTGRLQSEEKARSGKYAIHLTPKEAFGLTTKFWDFNPGDRIVVSIWRYPAGSNTGIVVDSEYQNSFYNFNKDVVIKEENGWEQIQSEIIIPSYTGTDRFSLYIWNSANEEVWLDDIQIDKTK